MRVLEPRGGADLAQEALGAEASGEEWEEDLEGDRPVVAEVTRKVDDRHAAPPELALEDVPLPQRLLEAIPRLRGGHDAVRSDGSGVCIGFKLSDRPGAGHGAARSPRRQRGGDPIHAPFTRIDYPSSQGVGRAHSVRL